MQYLSLSQAAKIVPGTPHPSSIWRWCRYGVRARNGKRIRLRHSRAGSRVYTTERWLDEFFEATAAADIERLGQADEAPAEQVSASVAEVDAELREGGW